MGTQSQTGCVNKLEKVSAQTNLLDESRKRFQRAAKPAEIVSPFRNCGISLIADPR
jgi:hypothetical protein